MSAYVFPGHTGWAGARAELLLRRPDLLRTVSAAVGEDPFPRAREDARFEQPVLTALSLARWSAVRNDSSAVAFVGHSTGEIAALAAAEAMSEADAIWLASVRGRLMSEQASKTGVAALTLRGAGLRAARELAFAHDLTIASDNAPGEVVLVGPRILTEAAARTARKLGLRSVGPALAAAIPSPEFGAGRAAWRAALEAAEIRAPRFPVFSCASLRLVIEPRASLSDSLTAPVRFRQALLALDRLGVCRFTVVGRNKRHAKLVSRTLPRAVVETLPGHERW